MRATSQTICVQSHDPSHGICAKSGHESRVRPYIIALRYTYQVRQARDAAQQQGSRDMSAAIQRVDAAGAGLERLAERQRTGREQVRQVAIMTAVGAVAGVIVWVCFSGPVARALPAGWSVPEKMAAATLRLDRWEAGGRLMETANPQGWAQLVEGAKLERDNLTALKGCGQSANRKKKSQLK